MRRRKPAPSRLPPRPSLGRGRSFKLERFIPFILSNLSERASYGVRLLYSERFGIDRAQWRVIAVLGELGSASAVDVVEATCMDKVTISRAMKALAGRKLIALRPCREDRRRRLARLTASGRRVHREVSRLAHAWEADLLEDMGEQQCRKLAEAFHSLDKALRERDL